MKTIQTKSITFNKTVKKEIVKLMPQAKTFRKKHVAGVGYVYFIDDSNKKTIGKAFKELRKGIKIIIN